MMEEIVYEKRRLNHLLAMCCVILLVLAICEITIFAVNLLLTSSPSISFLVNVFVNHFTDYQFTFPHIIEVTMMSKVLIILLVVLLNYYKTSIVLLRKVQRIATAVFISFLTFQFLNTLFLGDG